MTLKTVFKDGQVLFEDLGDKFTLNSDHRSPEKFKAISEDYFKGTSGSDPDCFAFISPLRMEQFDIPLYKTYRYFLLSERGCETMEIYMGCM